jgi:hypothetical protein
LERVEKKQYHSGKSWPAFLMTAQQLELLTISPHICVLYAYYIWLTSMG